MSTRAIVTAAPFIQPDLCTHAPASIPLSIAALQSPSLQRKCACNGDSCKSCEEDKERKLQRAGVSGAPQPSTVPPAVHEVLRSTGSPLDASSRAFFEPRFGHDFSRVRVHAGPRAAQSADAVGALAYTVGSDVVYAAGQFAPHSPSGRHLLAHELTHVVQQSGAPASLPISFGSDDTLEHEADHIADRITNNIPGSVGAPAHSTAGPRIQRKPAASKGGPANASRGPAIVEDGLPTAPGQMNRSAFLATLRDTLIRDSDAELRPFNRTAQGCPYILRTIERYARRPIASLMRVLQAFAHPPATADAQTIIEAVTQKARIVARNLGQKYGDRLQAMPDGPAASVPGHDPAAVRSQLGAGRPLDSSPRRAMETTFGHDFSSVRIHADPTAARLNNQLRARAFTIGQHIAFSEGAYRPGTRDGDTLLAHELAHTVQQRSGLPGTSGPTSEQHLERQAERAASAALSSASGPRQPDDGLDLSPSDLRIQRWPAIVAGAIITAEATPEVVVIAEVATVSTEVVVVDGAIVATADVAVPAAIDTLAPAAIETVAPAAIETVAPAASTAVSTTATAIGIGAATTLSSDSPTHEDESKRRNCQRDNPFFIPCEEEISMDEQVQEFIMRQGYGYESLGDCHGMSSFGPNTIAACNGAPGESFHCNVSPYYDPVARVQKPGGVVSVFSCSCCRADGTVGVEFRADHWSGGK